MMYGKPILDGDHEEIEQLLSSRNLLYYLYLKRSVASFLLMSYTRQMSKHCLNPPRERNRLITNKALYLGSKTGSTPRLDTQARYAGLVHRLDS